MRHHIKTLLIFLAIPLLVLEFTGRFMTGADWYQHWFSAEASTISRAQKCCLFIGSSRVAAAIDEQTFSKTCQSLSGQDISVFNLGLGYSTLAECYLGLRDLSERRSGGLSGCTVFVEAAGGLPSWDSWNDSWVKPPANGPLVDTIEARDIPAFLFHSNTPLGDKLFVVASKVLKSPGAVARLRTRIASYIDNAPIVYEETSVKQTTQTVDLSAKGGIRSDAYGAELARQSALKESMLALRSQQAISEAAWNKTVLRSIVMLVRNKGGEVVIFNMPLSRVQQTPLTTAQRLQDKQTFLKTAQLWKVPVLSVPMELSERDFPDFMHLSKTRAAEFSQRLALSFAQQIGIGKTSSR